MRTCLFAKNVLEEYFIQEVKKIKSYNAVTSKSGGGRSERFQLDGFGHLYDSFLPQRFSFIPDNELWSTVADASSAVGNIGENS